MTKIEEQTRQDIAKFLPDALSTALSSYQLFSDSHIPDPGEAKAFKDHHDACKVAIAHIQLLIKLAEWAKLPDAKVGDHHNQIRMMMLMQEGKETIQEDRDKHGEEED